MSENVELKKMGVELKKLSSAIDQLIRQLSSDPQISDEVRDLLPMLDFHNDDLKNATKKLEDEINEP